MAAEASEARVEHGHAFDALRALGVTDASEAALLVPEGFDDFTQTLSTVASVGLVAAGVRFVFVGTVVSTPRRADRGPPRYQVGIADAAGEPLSITIFGNDHRILDPFKVGERLAVVLVCKDKGTHRFVTYVEVLEPEWIGRVRPVYPVPKANGAQAHTRHVVQSYLPTAVPEAAHRITAEIEALAPVPIILAAVGCQGWTLEQILWQIHSPKDVRYAEHARAAYMRIAALAARWRAMESSGPPKDAVPLPLASLDERIAKLPYTLTEDQARAVAEMRARLDAPVAARSVLSGEVGTGKSLVAFLLMAGVADLGKRSLLMAPTFPLAQQLLADFVRLFPEHRAVLVAADTPIDGAASAPVIVGTSAVLSRDLGRFDLVIVDEQQRWSREQREFFVTRGTHLIEMSATCIPRTQALMKLGNVTISEMRQTHAHKIIRTHLWHGQEGATAVFARLKAAVAQGHPAVVVYPKKQGDGEGKKSKSAIDERYSVELALPRWEKMFPGRVRALTGEDDNAAKTDALRAMANGELDALIVTSVLEVGISLPNLYQMVIVHPDRYGLTTLHQFRGRLARNGGEGDCHLLVTGPLAPKAQERLETFVRTNDGFALAEADMRARGTGDLGADSKSQSGADGLMVFGAPLSMDVIEEVGPIWDALVDGNRDGKVQGGIGANQNF